MSKIQVKFYGVRGSLPTPLTPTQVENKILTAYSSWRINTAGVGNSFEEWLISQPREIRSTYGGNTPCVLLDVPWIQIVDGEEVEQTSHFILDMGSGLANLGKDLIPEIFKNRGLHANIYLSHVHFDHIQGCPFFTPLFLSNEKVDCRINLFGGKDWDSNLEDVLCGQMDHPVFPIKLEELEQIGAKLTFCSVNNNFTNIHDLGANEVRVKARKLNHPQETFGYRFEIKIYTGPFTPPEKFVVVYTTDHEAFTIPDPNLVELAKDADIWITECQYTFNQYKGPPAKLGWGHCYPEYVAEVAKLAKPKRIITFHHAPENGDVIVRTIAEQVQQLSGIPTEAAYEGMVLEP